MYTMKSTSPNPITYNINPDIDLLELIIEQNNTIIEQNNTIITQNESLIKYLHSIVKHSITPQP